MVRGGLDSFVQKLERLKVAMENPQNRRQILIQLPLVGSDGNQTVKQVLGPTPILGLDGRTSLWNKFHVSGNGRVLRTQLRNLLRCQVFDLFLVDFAPGRALDFRGGRSLDMSQRACGWNNGQVDADYIQILLSLGGDVLLPRIDRLARPTRELSILRPALC